MVISVIQCRMYQKNSKAKKGRNEQSVLVYYLDARQVICYLRKKQADLHMDKMRERENLACHNDGFMSWEQFCSNEQIDCQSSVCVQ